jgi:hypothetical protein
LQEEHSLGVFKIRVLKKIFGPKWEKTGDWRKWRSKDLPHIRWVKKIKQHEISETCGTYGDERRGAYGVMLGKPDGKRLLGRHWRKWEDNIKMDLQEFYWSVFGLICLRIGRTGGVL